MITWLDKLSLRLLSTAKGTLASYCPLDTAVDEHTFVTHAGNLVSYLLVEGTCESSVEGSSQTIDEFETTLSGMLEKPYYQLQWVFSKTPLDASTLHNEHLSYQIESAKRMQFDETIIKRILNEKATMLANRLHQESAILVFTTLRSHLPKHEKPKEHLTKAQRDALSKIRLPNRLGKLTQPLFTHTESLMRLHEPAIHSILSTFSRPPLLLQARKMSCHEALSWLRRRFHPEHTHFDWRGVLPGDNITAKAEASIPGEHDDIFYPSIARQIFTHKATTPGSTMHLAERYWGSIYLLLSPTQLKSFNALLSSFPAFLDWQVSFTLVGGSDKFKAKIRTKTLLAKFAQIGSPSYNREIANACESLNAIFAEENACGFRLNLAVCASTQEKAEKDTKTAAQILQSWGYCDVGFEYGCQVDGVVSSFPGFDISSVGETLVVPLRDAVTLLPFNRPYSPWPLSSSTLWSTLDGKLFPYQAGSSLQKTWVSLIYAPPGSGKSMHMNMMNFDMVFSSGQSTLPYIAILDVGYSSKGLIDLLQASLPFEQKHAVRHLVLTNAVESAINPFDTPLGFRYPIASSSGFLSNFLLELLTERGQSTVIQGLGEMVDDLIAACYRYLHDDYQPRVYSEGLCAELDIILPEYPELFSRKEDRMRPLTFWQLADVLAKSGNYTLAAMAQRYAVPNLSDLPLILRSDKALQDNYQRTEKGKELLEALSLILTSRIRKFPMLSHPSVLDVTGSRIVAVDLGRVIVSGALNDNTNGLLYLLARHLLVSHFYRDEHDLAGCPDFLRSYHEKQIRQLKQHTKRACFDEFHRTEKRQNVTAQIERDMREARKYNIEYMLASQLHDDFSDAMVSLASNIFICNGANDEALESMGARFGLSAAAKSILKHQIHGAGKDGATFLLKSEVKDKSLVQPLRNIAGKHLLWALTTVSEDAEFRGRLQTVMTYDEVIGRLVRWFPHGSALQLFKARVATNPNLTKEAFFDEFFNRLVNDSTYMQESQNERV